MLFFLLTLILSLILSATLLIGLGKSLQINWARKNRRPISFLTPVILTSVFVLLTLTLTIPRMLDTVSILAGNYAIDEVHIAEGDIGWNTLNDGQRQFFFNQWRIHFEADKNYRLTYTPNSLYIVDYFEVDSTAASE